MVLKKCEHKHFHAKNLIFIIQHIIYNFKASKDPEHCLQDIENLEGQLTLVLQARRGVSMLSGSAKKKTVLNNREVVL
jgi:hypothetical protein